MAGADEVRARFRAAYRGTLPPDEAFDLLASGDGDPVRTAEAAAYRREADPDAAERLRAIRAATAATARPEHPAPRTPGPTATTGVPPRTRGRTVAAVGTALVVGLLIGALAALAVTGAPVRTTGSDAAAPSVQRGVQARVLRSRGAFTAQDYYRLYPDDLPIDWGGASTGRGFRALTGATGVELHPSPDSSRLLVVPTCAAADGAYRWTLRTAAGRRIATGGGRCGAFAPAQAAIPSDLRGRPLRLAIAVDGPEPYSTAVFER